MPAHPQFKGFTPAGVDFYAQLARHNSRAWYEERKAFYQEQVLAPARALVEDLGQALLDVAPGLHADPRVNRSLFRIQRDTRFSADKSPYKTHLGLWLWEGEGPRMECPGFYFHLEPPRLMLAAGLYLFPKPLLQAYRQAVADPKEGPALVKAIKAVRAAGPYEIGGLHYQRVPRGFDPKHPRAELLRHNTLHASIDGPIPEEMYSPALVEWCVRRFLDMAPLHKWLEALSARVWRESGELKALEKEFSLI